MLLKNKTAASLFTFVMLCVGLVLWVPPLAAQLTTTGVHGLVRDPSGAVIPNANPILLCRSREPNYSGR